MRKKIMSLKSHALSETATLHLKDASGEFMYADDAMKLPVTLTLYGEASKQYHVASRKFRDLVIDKKKGFQIKDLPDEEYRKIRADFLSKCVADSKNFELDGQKGEELYRAVFSDISFVFIVTQVEEFIKANENFTGKPLTN